ncbi:YceI family protein [Cyclobacterium salsum]|uniref:YceI family protein n=1 Tax=Cyclobacterium salsum TaxID=2666329 RepID=UPI001391209F|nr:YceI family protein [Cyclobacterium salsum]
MASKSLIIDHSSSEVSFQVKKLGIFTIKGRIEGFTGKVSFSKEALKDAHFDVCVSPSSINTGNAKRDEHLKSKDFFYVNEHPNICFQSTSTQATVSGYEAVGTLSILGITKKVSIPFSFSEGIFVGQFSINRLDFKLGEKFPALIVGKTIHITINCKIK